MMLFKQATDFSYKEFTSIEMALSFLIAKLPITLALVVSVGLLIGFVRYCIDIIKNVSNQSLELTKFSVLARHIIDDSSHKFSGELSISEINYEKSKIIGQLLADSKRSEDQVQLPLKKNNKNSGQSEKD